MTANVRLVWREILLEYHRLVSPIQMAADRDTIGAMLQAVAEQMTAPEKYAGRVNIAPVYGKLPIVPAM
jgi:hypothetical protein